MAGNAVAQTQELTQKRLLRLAEQRHVRTIFATTQHGAQRDHQYLMQIVPDVVLAWVDHPGKTRNKLFHGTPPALNPILGIHPTDAPQAISSREKPYAIPLRRL